MIMCRPGSEGCRDGKNVLLVTRMSILGITLPRIQNKTQDLFRYRNLFHISSLVGSNVVRGLAIIVREVLGITSWVLRRISCLPDKSSMIPPHIPHLCWVMTFQKLLIYRHSFDSKHSSLFLYLLHKHSFCHCCEPRLCAGRVCGERGVVCKIRREKQEGVSTSMTAWSGIWIAGWGFWLSRRGWLVCWTECGTFSSILSIISIKKHLSEIRISVLEYILSGQAGKH